MEDFLSSRVGRALKGLIDRKDSGWTINRIAQTLEEMYEEGLTPARCDSHSLNRILAGTGSHASTIESVRQFFLHCTEIKIPIDMRELNFDFRRFFDIPSIQLSGASKSIVGDYQLYARSNILPDYLWRGRVTFWEENGGPNTQLYIYLESHRQKIHSYGPKEYRSEGPVCAVGEYMYNIIFRSDFETGDENAVPALAQRINRSHGSQIDRLRVHAIQFESEENKIMHSHWALYREKRSNIKLDFIDINAVSDRWVRKELNL